MRRSIPALIATCVILQAGAAAADESLVEMLRVDLRSDLRAVVDASMELNEAQEEIFWPIYREFEEETATLGDRRLALIERFGENLESLAESEAKALADEWFAQQEDRLAIRKRTYKKLAKALTPSIAARFIQVENQLGLLIDLQLASDNPLIRGSRDTTATTRSDP